MGMFGFGSESGSPMSPTGASQELLDAQQQAQIAQTAQQAAQSQLAALQARQAANQQALYARNIAPNAQAPQYVQQAVADWNARPVSAQRTDNPVGMLTVPGTNPGWVTPTQAYSTGPYNYYWGKHQYAATPDQLENYNVGVPQQQQQTYTYAPFDVAAFTQRLLNAPAPIATTNTKSGS
jgi:hypothetical protein